MTEEAFTDEDSEHPRSDRFKARREMINAMIQMGVTPSPVRFETPKGAINGSKLREMYKDPNTEEGQKLIQIGQQFDRPPGTGKIRGLVELARKERLTEAKPDETQSSKVIGKPNQHLRHITEKKDKNND